MGRFSEQVWGVSVERHHQLRAEFIEAGLLDIDVIGVEGPLGSFARQDPELNQVAISAARASEHLAPHLSLHLLACGRLD